MKKNDKNTIIDNLIDGIRSNIISLKLAEKTLDYLKFENITREELKLKLVELMELTSEIKVTENICLNGLAKL